MLKTSRFALVVLSIIISVYAAACGGGQATGGTGEQEGEAKATEAGQVSNEPFVPFADIATVELLTATNGVGIKPLFEWSPVNGAASYSVYVQFSDGQPYWAWSGTDTSVYLGGLHFAPPENAEGPILLDGMAWAVLAFDANGNVIASSVLQPISP